MVRFLEDGFPRKPARLVRPRVILHKLTVQRGVRGDQSVEAAVEKCGGEIRYLLVGQIGRDLEEDGHAFRMAGGEVFLRFFQGIQQPRGGVGGLQIAETGGVRRGKVHRDVIRHRIGFFQAGEIIVGRILIRGVLVFPDVETDGAGEGLVGADVGDARVDARVVEAHAVDDCLVGDEPEQARLGIPRLRTRRDRADLDEAEAEPPERVDGVALLVEPRREADAVRKLQAH